MSPAPQHPHRAPRPADSGLRALAAALARLLTPATSAASAEWTDSPPSGAAAPPPPGSAWERQAERRLGVIEKTLNNQNRLLLLTLVSVVADVVLGSTK